MRLLFTILILSLLASCAPSLKNQALSLKNQCQQINTITKKSSSVLEIGIDETLLNRASFFKNQSLELERLQISDSNLKDVQDGLVKTYDSAAKTHSEIVDSIDKLNKMRRNKDVEGETEARGKLGKHSQRLSVINQDNKGFLGELNRLCQ